MVGKLSTMETMVEPVKIYSQAGRLVGIECIRNRLGDVDAAPNVPADRAPEPLEVRGPRLHTDGEDGFR